MNAQTKENDMDKVSEFIAKDREYQKARAEFGALIWPAVLLAGQMSHYDTDDIIKFGWKLAEGKKYLYVELGWIGNNSTDEVMIPEVWLHGDISDNVESIQKSRKAKREKEIRETAVADLHRRAAELGMTVSEEPESSPEPVTAYNPKAAEVKTGGRTARPIVHPR